MLSLSYMWNCVYSVSGVWIPTVVVPIASLNIFMCKYNWILVKKKKEKPKPYFQIKLAILKEKIILPFRTKKNFKDFESMSIHALT